MTSRSGKRLPGVKTLYEVLPRGSEGGKEFSRIVDLLLFHEARRRGQTITIFNDAAGDYHGLDSFERPSFRQHGSTGYQYKFYPSPLSAAHRQDIIKVLKITAASPTKTKLKKWILVTPEDLTESSTRKDSGDVTWFESLHAELSLPFELDHWGHKKLLALFLETPSLCLYYYPELTDDGIASKKTLEDVRKRYDDNLPILYKDIQFIGMSVYKQEATRGVAMEHIYIPLQVIPETQYEQSANVSYRNPLSFLSQGKKQVLLGDPGSGKSTLLRFLALSGISKSLQKRYGAMPDKRLPVLVVLRRYADELKSRSNLSLVDFIMESIQADFNLKSADITFFEYYFETGQTIFLFDGLDELPSAHFKQMIRDRIRTLITTYPGNTVVISSRIVGYDGPLRFENKEFSHYLVAKLQLPEIEQFVRDWYRVRIENEREREANIRDLIRIFQDKNHASIRELAENPLLLTIIALVHRIDAVLPDERVVLYQKCTETLLNTWHNWKFRETEVKNKGKIERRNRHRLEAIAYWMHCQSGGTDKNQRAIVPYEDLLKFLSEHIGEIERLRDPDNEPEDLAKDFILFIKTRAGLLVEVGDNQYSFVHLTFQEFLTSSHIITIGEKDGVAGIWKIIKDHYNDSRWHEVIRLIVAGLKNNESQKFLVETLLSETASSPHINISRLLGGLLLDGIEAAEYHKIKILSILLNFYGLSKDGGEIRYIISLLRSLTVKDTVGAELIYSILTSVISQIPGKQQRIALELIKSIVRPLGTEIEIGHDKREESYEKDINKELYKVFFEKGPKSVDFLLLKDKIETFWILQDYLALHSPHANLLAAIGQAIVSSIDDSIAYKRLFLQQMILFCTGTSNGPFSYYNFNNLGLIQEYTQSLFGQLPAKPFPGYEPEKTLVLDRALALAWVNVTNPQVLMGNKKQIATYALGKTFLLTRAQLRAIFHNTKDLIFEHKKVSGMRDEIQALLYLACDLVRKQTKYRLGSKFKYFKLEVDKFKIDLLENIQPIWKNLLADNEFNNLAIKLFCDGFHLNPHIHWQEMLRMDFFPNISQRFTMYSQQLEEQIKRSFEKRLFGEKEIYYAAWLLMFDGWLNIYGYYASSDDSLFNHIADLTRDINVPPLRIAHCIRDLCYNDVSRTKDLIEMINSQDPAYRIIFEECLWCSNSKNIFLEADDQIYVQPPLLLPDS